MEIVGFAVGALGLAYGVWSRWYLWRWAQECKGTRIAISYKSRMRLDAPLTEWMLWGRQVMKDKDSPGSARIVFSASHTNVMVVRRVRTRTVLKMKWDRLRRRGDPPEEDEKSKLPPQLRSVR